MSSFEMLQSPSREVRLLTGLDALIGDAKRRMTPAEAELAHCILAVLEALLVPVLWSDVPRRTLYKELLDAVVKALQGKRE